MLFPQIDPIAFSIFGLPIRWYALAYLVGLLVGWRWCMRLVKHRLHTPLAKDYDDFLSWAVIGVVAGGRFGYVLIYNFAHYLQHPMEILLTWHGGMSFHGGMLGVIAAAALFARRRGVGFWRFIDPIAAVTPLGLGLGRVANFINGELYGRVTDAPWGMVFPHGGDLPRHPSQLYQAATEGLLLLLVLIIVRHKFRWDERPGLLSGVFLSGYGCARIAGEFFREPDAQLGFLFGRVTMGQILSVPMVLMGLWLIFRPQTIQPK
jgi:phosphatidylglycerol---prolipoprotein diacylglyceryl transferase